MKSGSNWLTATLLLAVLARPCHSQAEERASRNRYAVGSRAIFFHDESKSFDPWGAKYKSKECRDLIKQIDAAGDRRSVHAIIHYPAIPATRDSKAELAMMPAALPKARDGQPAPLSDFLPHGQSDRRLPFPERECYTGATPADGRFPLVLMLHGLGGGHGTWYRAAERLTSRGYVVVTVAFTSDGSMTPVFDDPESRYAQTRTPEQLRQDYQVFLSAGDRAVFGNFFKFMFGEEIQGGFPEASSLKAVEGGGVRAGRMMGDLFEMRTEDVGIVIANMKRLNESDPILQGCIDASQIGVMGHSLGSITSQSALVYVPEVKTAIGFNNGLPRSWEPYGGYPDSSGDAERPDGVPRDVLLLIGSDDNFVHMVFRDIFLKFFIGAGGDVTETMPLPMEQVWPTVDNPQPIARASYERATARKMLLTFKDQTHDSLIDPAVSSPGDKSFGRRVPLDPTVNANQAERFEQRGWIDVDGRQVHRPTEMRDYYIRNWYDWQLKGDDSARQRLIDHPFGEDVQQMLHHGVDVPASN